MKSRRTSLLLIVALATTFAHAQNNISQVQHVIVVLQENRTSTNLLHEDAALVSYGRTLFHPITRAFAG
jgi:hypothetical protein